MKPKLYLLSLLLSVTAPLTAAKTIDPAVDGMELRLSNMHKTINIELPDGEFLELNIPIPYFEAPKEAFIQVKDVQKLQTYYATIRRSVELPVQAFIQPTNQQALLETLENLNNLIQDLESRIFAFSNKDHSE